MDDRNLLMTLEEAEKMYIEVLAQKFHWNERAKQVAAILLPRYIAKLVDAVKVQLETDKKVDVLLKG